MSYAACMSAAVVYSEGMLVGHGIPLWKPTIKSHSDFVHGVSLFDYENKQKML